MYKKHPETFAPGPSKARISTFNEELWPIDKDFTRSRAQPRAGRLSVPEKTRSEEAKELTWETLQSMPQQVFDVPLDEEEYFTVVPDGSVSMELDLDVLLIRRKSSKLLVVFHGALDRTKFTLPRMEYKRSLQSFDGSVLFVADPTLYAHQELTLGWYVGTQRDSGHVLITQLVEQLVKALAPDQLIFTGSSGGGFAAMAVSARIPESVALAFSPQTAIENYYMNHRRRLVSSAFPELVPSPLTLSEFEERFDLGALYSRGTTNRVFYVQNTGDPSHLRKHCMPFMALNNLDILAGEMRNEHLSVECSFLRKGHGGPSPKQLRTYIDKAVAGEF